MQVSVDLLDIYIIEKFVVKIKCTNFKTMIELQIYGLLVSSVPSVTN